MILLMIIDDMSSVLPAVHRHVPHTDYKNCQLNTLSELVGCKVCRFLLQPIFPRFCIQLYVTTFSSLSDTLVELVCLFTTFPI